MPKDAFEYHLEILRDEIQTIHTRMGAFDDLSFRVKGWASTLWAVLIGYAVSEDVPECALISIPLMGVFWLLDALFKRYQEHVRARMGIIERFLNGTSDQSGISLTQAFKDHSFGSFVIHDPMCIQTVKRADSKYQAYFERKVSLLRAVRKRNVCLIYIGLIFASVGTYIYLLSSKGT